MSVIKCEIPACSGLDRRQVDSAYFQDSYRAPLSRPGASVVEIFHAIFSHHPMWMKVVLIVRNRLASLFGLDAPTASEILHAQARHDLAVGDTIGVWPVYALGASELVAGRDNKHLDFRLSVLKTSDGGAAHVVVSTICNVHNTFGKVYLFFIVPFHKWGVQRLIANALAAGRL